MSSSTKKVDSPSKSLIIDTKNYTRIINELKTQHGAQLFRWYTALGKCVTEISPNNMQELISAFLSFDWTDKIARPAYITFLLHLISATGEFLVPVLRMLVKNFILTLTELEIPNLLDIDSDLEKLKIECLESKIENFESFHNDIHDTLESISNLIPSSSHKLLLIITDKFPHKRYPLITQNIYLKNLLRLTEYIPFLTNQIFSLIIDKLSLIESDIPQVPIMNQVPLSTDEETLKTEKRSIEYTQKLDSLITMIFEYLHLVYASSTEDHRNRIFFSLTSAFQSSLFNNRKSKHLQFIPFYYTSLEHRYSDTFLRKLIDILFSDTSLISRQLACQYIISFLSSSSFIRHEGRMTIVRLLLKWAWERSVPVDNGKIKIPGNMEDNHIIIYHVVNGIIYLCVNRSLLLTDLLGLTLEFDDNYLNENEKKHKIDYKERLQFLDILNSNLYPLRYCNHDLIKSFFTTLKNSFPSVFSFPLEKSGKKKAEKRKRSTLLSFDQLFKSIPSINSLDDPLKLQEYFPFDGKRYLLSDSHKFIKPLLI